MPLNPLQQIFHYPATIWRSESWSSFFIIIIKHQYQVKSTNPHHHQAPILIIIEYPQGTFTLGGTLAATTSSCSLKMDLMQSSGRKRR